MVRIGGRWLTFSQSLRLLRAPPLVDGVSAEDAGYGWPAAGTPADAPDAPRPRSQPLSGRCRQE